MRAFSEIERLRDALATADAVLVGAGAGLSAAAGFDYGGARFAASFGDFAAKYGFHDMYAGGFYPYATPSEFFAYWSRYIFLNRYSAPPRRTYETLFSLLQDKDYFVLTTNVDHCFQKAGFDKARLFYTQGDYGLWQCSAPCCAETFDNEADVRRMLSAERDMRVPAHLLPRCPHCHRLMTVNLRTDDRFVEDAGWHAAAARYEHFVRAHRDKKLLLLELGVGYNTPGIIKYPFWHMAAAYPHATYACVDLAASAPRELADRSIVIPADIDAVLQHLSE